MGFNVCTVAVRDQPIEHIHAAFGLRATETREEDPEAAVVAAMLPSGWYQLYLNNRDCPNNDMLRELSLNAELIFVDVCESASTSHASCWRGGKEAWSITHDPQRDPDELRVTGELPTCFEPISRRLRDAQKENGDADYIFDVPIEVTQELTGFRYDGNPSGYPVNDFTVLEPVEPPRRWWQLWRGSRWKQATMTP